MVSLTDTQVREFARKLKMNDSVVLREYAQLLFLKELYFQKYSDHIFFKGGTAIRLVFGGERFSEDLDFSVTGERDDFNHFISTFYDRLSKLYGWSIKKRKTIVGETYVLSITEENKDYGLFIKLDFSFREKVLQPTKSIIDTIYPVVFTSFVHHLSKEEILAEKIRAVMTRSKGRDIYDLWFLFSQGVEINTSLVMEKYKYYGIESFDRDALVDKISSFSKEQFVTDLRPFIPINQRSDLPRFFDYVLAYIRQKVH
jgi:hypothetical protein